MPERKISHILDTSAIIAYLADEPGADIVAGVKDKSAIPFIALSELYYIIFRKRGKPEADKIFGLVKSWAASILYPQESIIITAGRFKSSYALGIADSYIAAFAREERSILLTKDPDYKVLQEEIMVKYLNA
ncbi:MAG: PIN domain-containing protein [Candidatus Omnitrophica bacterium]|nr:PIN domain-containing protein [Candidatus Omnitrophota bacterium]